MPTIKRTRRPVASVPGRQAPRGTAPTSPPPGSYDPAIDAQVGAAGRGLADLLSDYVRDWGEPGTALAGRQGQDYRLSQSELGRRLAEGLADLNLGSDRALEDLRLGSGRSLNDLMRDRTRGGEDYGESIAALGRRYQRLGDAQRQGTIAKGVQRGGALAQALQKRAANQAIDRKPIDTGFQRFSADSSTAEQRLIENRGLAERRIGENRALGTGRLNQGYQFDLSGLNRSYLRGGEDSATQLARAQRENTQFGLDANVQRLYEADTILPNLVRRRSIRRTR